MLTPEMREKSLSLRREAAKQKINELRLVMERKKSAGEPKPNHQKVREWTMALGHTRGLASHEMQRLIVEVWGPGRPVKEQKHPDLPTHAILRKLDMVLTKLDEVINL